MLLRLLLIVITFLVSSESYSERYSSAYDHLFNTMGNQYSVDPLLLKAIAIQESGLNPYATNVNMESFIFKSKTEALEALSYMVQRPWMLKLYSFDSKGKRKIARRFFRSQTELDTAISSFNSRRSNKGKDPLKVVTTTTYRSPKTEYILARKLNVNSTDIGFAQINYHWHDNKKYNVADWYNPNNNIRYQAQLMAKLIKTHGDIKTAVGYYHGGGKGEAGAKRRVVYRDSVFKIYNQLTTLGTLASN